MHDRCMFLSTSFYASEGFRLAISACSVDQEPNQSLTNGTHVGSAGKATRKLWRL